MPIISSLIWAAGLLSLASGFAVPRDAYPASGSASTLYFLRNEKSGAFVTALDLTNSSRAPVNTPTGGTGLSVVNGTTGKDVPFDSATGQGILSVVDNTIFVANPGSNTLSMFTISPSDPTHPKLVGKPVDTLGDFPKSVAHSKALNLVCVLNGGKRNSVACFKINSDNTLTADGPARPLNLTLQTPPLFGSGDPSQVQFTPDNKDLIVTIKGKGNFAPNLGQVVVYKVASGKVAASGVSTSMADLPQAFGFAFADTTSNFFISDTGFGGAVVNLQSDQHIKTVSFTNESGHEQASCWAAWSRATDRFYSLDARVPELGVYEPSSGAFDGFLQFDASLKGSFDGKMDNLDGKSLWFLAQAPVVASYDVQAKKLSNNLPLSVAQAGERMYWQGLGLWPTS